MSSNVAPPAHPPRKLTGDPAALKAFIDRFDTFLFDCDGVLWSGPQLLPLTPQILSYLSSLGKTLLFVTNNSTKSRISYVQKFANFGIENISPGQIFTSSYSAALYISRILKLQEQKKKIYIIGESGIEAELAEQGIEYFGGTDDADNGPIGEEEQGDRSIFGPDETVGAVLCGLDRQINYRKLAKGYQYLQHPDTLFLATNLDSTFPSHGLLFPGAGTTSAALKYMLGENSEGKLKKELTSFGKPSQAMMDAIEASGVRFDRSKACMIGDRLNTDIRFGVEAGLGGTLAVLTGVVKEEEILRGDGGVWAEAYVEGLADLLAAKEA